MNRFAPGALLLALLLSGCANYAKSMRVDEPVVAGSAYFYGYFFIDAPTAFLAMDGHATMGFTYTCNGKQNYTIRFSNKDPLQVIKIKPGSCSMKEIVFTDADGTIKDRNEPNPEMMKPFTVEPDVAYYLGDFHAVMRTRSTGYNMIESIWSVDRVENLFDDRTIELKDRYKGLASVRAVNHMFGASAP